MERVCVKPVEKWVSTHEKQQTVILCAEAGLKKGGKKEMGEELGGSGLQRVGKLK